MHALVWSELSCLIVESTLICLKTSIFLDITYFVHPSISQKKSIMQIKSEKCQQKLTKMCHKLNE